MRRHYTTWNLITATTFAALLFATLRLPRPVTFTIFVVFVWSVFHAVLAYRLGNYASIFPGAVSAMLTDMIFAECLGVGQFGTRWLEFGFEPLSVVRWFTMAVVGIFVQIQYTRIHHAQRVTLEDNVERSEPSTRHDL